MDRQHQDLHESGHRHDALAQVRPPRRLAESHGLHDLRSHRQTLHVLEREGAVGSAQEIPRSTGTKQYCQRGTKNGASSTWAEKEEEDLRHLIHQQGAARVAHLGGNAFGPHRTLAQGPG